MVAVLQEAHRGLRMSVDLSPQEALARVPGLDGEAWNIEPLGGGLTNRSFVASGAGRRLVVRLDDVHTADFSIDRETEFVAHRQAAKAGLASNVVFADAGAGVLITEFVVGSVWGAGDLQRTENLEALAAVVRSAHQLPVLGISFSPSQAAQTYMAGIGDRPALLSFGRHCQDLIDAGSALQAPVFSHNDLVAENIVAGNDIVLLDWEYAMDNDPMFDFASLSCYHDLQEWQLEVLLSAYAGTAAAEYRERLACQQRIFDALQWLWFAVRHRRSPDKRLAARLEELQQRIR